jgi:hypothetical protein
VTAGDTFWFIDDAGLFLGGVVGTDERTNEIPFSAPASNTFGLSANFVILRRIYSSSKAYITKAVYGIYRLPLSRVSSIQQLISRKQQFYKFKFASLLYLS